MRCIKDQAKQFTMWAEVFREESFTGYKGELMIFYSILREGNWDHFNIFQIENSPQEIF